MKKVSWIFYLSMFACAILFPSCQDEEKSPIKPGDVRFTIRSRPLDSKGGRAASVLPPGGKLYVTVLKANGDVVFDLQEIPIAILNDYVISEPVTLPPGEYTVTQFIISNGGSGTYAAPLEGSSVAEWVDDPLPIPFAVSNGILTGLEVQVLPFNEERFTPEDFGYVSFGVKVVPYPYFRLAVFKPGPGGPVLDAAHAYLLDGADTLVNKALPPGTHEIAFVGDRSKAYTLVLEDETYGVYAQSFVLDSLLNRLQGEPWAVTMKPAVTIVSDDNGWNFSGMHLEGWRGEVSVDWGDGTRDVYGSDLGYSTDVPHEYDVVRHRVVSITGDLEEVSTVHVYSWAGIQRLNLDHLPSLLNLGITTYTRTTPTVLDLRKNTAIMTISASDSEFQSVYLPEPNHVSQVVFTDGALTSDGLNELVHAIYTSVVASGVRGGLLSVDRYIDGESVDFVAPPSAQALEELRILRDEYQWTIKPGNF
ncbi:hypothetical protein KK062_26380 [Fulvivirgaceae bacterium PWU5]|uniref:Uncharacterized protein n=1 Tax=Dawidia cretensis TaxID=2782350 RepID=A0AAP2E2I6_9BACT|nr:hypothetical protein [Dawidia cretensis]MBT1711796.1 hypothetical protein [Dawidia cretensis]